MPPFVLPNGRVASRSEVGAVSDPRLIVDNNDRKRMPKSKSPRPALCVRRFPLLMKSLHLLYFVLILAK
jgi:hypothetical protein